MEEDFQNAVTGMRREKQKLLDAVKKKTVRS